MDWDATEAVVSIPSRVRGGVTTAHQSQPSPNSEQITDTHAQPYTVEDEDVVASESLPDTPNRSSSHTHTHAHTTPRSKRNSSGQFASPTPTTSNYAHATTVKKVRNSSIGNASVPQNRSKLLPPPPATSHPASPSATNSLYAAYTSAHAATSGDTPAPTKYLGMQAPKTEWLLPTRVSVQERTTTTTAAKLNYKSPKADKNWKGYIPANQSHPFDLHFHRPKVLEAPLAPLPGNKNEKYDGPLQRVPVSEAITRASLDKRNEKNIKSQRGLPSQAQLLEDEIESRRADKRARFEQMTEKQKEAIWREVTHLQQKQMMLAEERAFVEGLRAKIRQARIDREEKWKAEEMKMRQKENLELRIPEARLAKYERWMRQEQEAELREKYIRETGQQPPAGYGKQEEADDEDDADKDELDVSNLLDDSTLPTPQLPTLPRFPTMDHGRFVESSYHSGSSSIGIEFKMLSENDPEANAPLFAPPTVAPTTAPITAAPSNTASTTAAQTTSVHSRGNGSVGTSTSSPVHHQRGPSSGHRTNVSSGSIGNLSQLGLSDGAAVQLEAAIESDHDDQPTDERKYSTHDQSPELSAQLRPTHAREPSHSAIRTGGSGVPADRNVAAGVSFAVDGDVDLDDLPAQSNSSRSGARSIGGVNANTGGVSATGDHSREASRARESRGTLGGVREEEAKTEPRDQTQPQSHALSIDANTPHGDETGDESTHKDYPPLAGNADEWDVDEQILSVGIQAIKIPRKKSMFGGPRQITLHLSQSASIPPNWLLQWNSKSKKSEDEFINLTHGLKSYQRGLRDGALASCGKDVANKYLYRANHCYTLQLSDRTLDLVILENSHSNAFDRVLSRIDHPSGQYRTPRAAASSTPSSSHNIDETMNSEGPQSSPSAFAISARAPVGASATAHGVMSAHHPPQTGLAGGVTTPLGAASSASPTSTVTAANPALLLAMAAQSSSSKNIHHPQSPSLSHSHPNLRTPTASPPQLDRQPTSESKSRTNSNNIPTARQNDE